MLSGQLSGNKRLRFGLRLNSRSVFFQNGSGAGIPGVAVFSTNQIAEFEDILFQCAGLADEFVCDAGPFFRAGGAVLNDFIHLAYRKVKLFNSLGLFAGSGGDFADAEWL